MPATQLEFTVQPSDTQVNRRVLPPIRVALKDGSGNVVTSATDEVSISIEDNPGGGVLSGTVVRKAVAGIAVFNDLKIDAPGVDYTLRATAEPDAGLNPADFCSLWVSGDAPTLATLLDGELVGDDPPWIDRITGVRQFQQVASGDNPTFKTGGPNGLPYLRFDATDRLIFSNTASAVLSTTGYLIFLVVRPQRAGNPACDWSGSVLYNFGGANGFGDISLCLSGMENKFRLNHYVGGGIRVSVNSGIAYNQNEWYIVAAFFDGSEIGISVNREPAITAPAANLATAANTPSLSYFGNTSSDFEEILQFNHYPSQTVISQFWEWLSTRTDIPLV